ncbi:MAG: hypothetical protein H7Y33_03950 [Cytophagales bacterium]|nr:hypothetical protein [Rhizobacter sp.]
MNPAMLPEAVQAMFQIAGIMPIFLPDLTREAWLSTSIKSGGRTLLVIDSAVDPDRLEEIASEALTAAAERFRVA